MSRSIAVLLLILLVLPSCAKRLNYAPAINFKATQFNGKRLSAAILKKEVTACQEYARKRMNEVWWYGYGGAALDIVGSAGNVIAGVAMGKKLPDSDDKLAWALTGSSVGLSVAQAYVNLSQIPAFDQKFLIDECLRQLGYILIQHK